MESTKPGRDSIIGLAGQGSAVSAGMSVVLDTPVAATEELASLDWHFLFRVSLVVLQNPPPLLCALPSLTGGGSWTLYPSGGLGGSPPHRRNSVPPVQMQTVRQRSTTTTFASFLLVFSWHCPRAFLTSSGWAGVIVIQQKDEGPAHTVRVFRMFEHFG